MAFKKKDLIAYLEVVHGGYSLGLNTAVRFAVKASPRRFRRQAEKIASIIEHGGRFHEALKAIGVSRELTMQVAGFEQEGNLQTGLENLIEMLKKQAEVEDGLAKIDRKLFTFTGLGFITLGVMVFLYLPTITEKLIMQIATDSRAKQDPLINFLITHFSGGFSVENAVVLLVLAVLAVVGLGMFKVHRYLMYLIPAYGKMLRENDKITVLTMILTTSQDVEAVTALKNLFKKKYNFDTVARLFKQVNYQAFKHCTLFDKDEREFISSVGAIANKDVISFLLSEVERKRNQYLDSIVSTMDLFVKVMMMIIVIALWAIPFAVMAKITTLIK